MALQHPRDNVPGHHCDRNQIDCELVLNPYRINFLESGRLDQHPHIVDQHSDIELPNLLDQPRIEAGIRQRVREIPNDNLGPDSVLRLESAADCLYFGSVAAHYADIEAISGELFAECHPDAIGAPRDARPAPSVHFEAVGRHDDNPMQQFYEFGK